MNTHTVRRAGVLLLAVALTAASLPADKPEALGLSSERLLRINQMIQGYIERGEISGAITMVSRRGKVAHFEAQGQMDLEKKAPMRKDAMFRIASMSKPITAVAILMLMEEGKLRLTDPVSRFIPEFTDTKVAIETAPYRPAANGQPARDAVYYTMPAERAITIRDLLTHTSGLESGTLGNRIGARTAPRNMSFDLAKYVPTLGQVPLDFQPGSRWSYSLLAGMETLGRIVEVASGMTFDQFLKQRLFDPLEMTDTTFVPTDAQLSRAVTLYTDRDGKLARTETPGWLTTKTLFSGGGGLWSTAEDYMRFGQMLGNGGVLNGKRILSPRTIDLMATNHVGDLYSGTGSSVKGLGFGLAVDVVLDNAAAGRRVSNGTFAWGGAFGTYFWVDRKEAIVGVLMVQEPVNSLRNDFQNAVMQAIIE
ncbi:MAG TPA: serine hydrolase domain-containing protein [Vicinamibacterales bacterium]|nr:serine hydrolase domain-containing protein [Vicinamibacterales bacterium]